MSKHRLATDLPDQPLLTPYTMAGLRLRNRLVLALLTRSRATNPDLAPTDLHVRYYAQRAPAGLIITEGAWVSRDAIGWHDAPGMFTDIQLRAWSAVVDAVHDAGGLIFAQLWHTGSSSHPDFFEGAAEFGYRHLAEEARGVGEPIGRAHRLANLHQQSVAERVRQEAWQERQSRAACAR